MSIQDGKTALDYSKSHEMDWVLVAKGADIKSLEPVCVVALSLGVWIYLRSRESCV